MSANAKSSVNVIDEMFPEGPGVMMDLDEPSGTGGFSLDAPSTDKIVHTDFYNRFDDLYDDNDVS